MPFPTNRYPSSKFGVALDLPAPPTLILPAEGWVRIHIPMFCICEEPVGATGFRLPEVPPDPVATYIGSPAGQTVVFTS